MHRCCIAAILPLQLQMWTLRTVLVLLVLVMMSVASAAAAPETAVGPQEEMPPMVRLARRLLGVNQRGCRRNCVLG